MMGGGEGDDVSFDDGVGFLIKREKILEKRRKEKEKNEKKNEKKGRGSSESISF